MFGVTSAPTEEVHVPKPGKDDGVSRGVDLVSVSCVVNFDLPVTSRVHRVTRTRGTRRYCHRRRAGKHEERQECAGRIAQKQREMG